MGVETNVQWATSSFNPVRGCQRVSPGCENCYAETFSRRNLKMLGTWGPNGTRVLASDAMWNEPLKWDRTWKAHQSEVWENHGPNMNRIRVFCASLSDVFEDWSGPIVDHKSKQLFWSHSRQPHETKWHWIPEDDCAGGETPVSMDDIRTRLFELIDATPNLDWLLLTKRPENIRRMWTCRKLRFDPLGPFDSPYPNADAHGVPLQAYYRQNVWLGTTCENQEYSDKRIPELLKCRDLSPVLWLSVEPMLGRINLRSKAIFSWCQSHGGENDQRGYPLINWVVCGGESGPRARSMDVEWARYLRDQCRADCLPFFMKQLSQADCPKSYGDFESFPEDLRVRQFPRVNR